MKAEKLYPIVLGLAAPILIWMLSVYNFSPSDRQLENIFNGAASLGGIVVGFLATSLAILFAVPTGPAVNFMKRTGGLKLIVGYLEQAIIFWLLSTLGALLLLFFLPNLRAQGLLLPVTLVWGYVFAVAILAFYRAASITGRFLRQLLDSTT